MEYFRNLVRAHVPRPQPEPPPQVPAQTMAELTKDVYRAPGETPSSTGLSERPNPSQSGAMTRASDPVKTGIIFRYR